MSDLISRSALLEGKVSNAYISRFEIEQAPTIDAEPVRHGHWISVEDYQVACICSVCDWKGHLYEDDVYGMPYCPNCGAKMDEN